MTENTLFPFPLGGRVFSCTKPGFRQYTNLSNYVQNSFTHFEAKCGTNIVDKGSRNPESIVIYNLLFLFYPLYFVK